MDASVDALLAVEASGLSYNDCLDHVLAMEQAIARFMAHQQVALAQLENHPPTQFRSSRLVQLARGRARVDRHPGSLEAA